MDDRVRIVSDEEFIAAVVDRACDMAFKGQGAAGGRVGFGS